MQSSPALRTDSEFSFDILLSGGYFAHDGGCAALKKMVCNAEGKCPFYRPQEKESEETA